MTLHALRLFEKVNFKEGAMRMMICRQSAGVDMPCSLELSLMVDKGIAPVNLTQHSHLDAHLRLSGIPDTLRIPLLLAGPKRYKQVTFGVQCVHCQALWSPYGFFSKLQISCSYSNASNCRGCAIIQTTVATYLTSMGIRAYLPRPSARFTPP